METISSMTTEETSCADESVCDTVKTSEQASKRTSMIKLFQKLRGKTDKSLCLKTQS